MDRERISEEKAGKIKTALKEHCRFLAYVRVNALLHDCDKSFADFLLWSLLPTARRSEVLNYNEHNKSDVLGKASVKRKEYVQYWQNNIARTTEDVRCGDIHFPASCYYLAYRYTVKEDKKDVEKISITKNKAKNCQSLYDFALYHHDQTNFLEEYAPTALLLFSSGSAGIDGNDTGYETEMEAGREKYSGHHTPDTAQDNIVLISTPFGFERPVDLGCAEAACHLTEEIQNVVTALRQDKQPMQAAARLEKKLEQPFLNTVIRTKRPINDITLSDHSISTAALTVAQAARVVLENIVAPDDTAYCLPVRRPCEDRPSQETAFAVFSCAVNADKLDQMALELKDITAIRKEAEKLLKHFLFLFSEKYPAGGAVYQDQHGAHVVVPELGNPAKRWIKGGADTLVRIKSEKQELQPEWADAPPGALGNEEFVDWLFATAERELRKFPVNFGAELLIGLRHQPIEQELNRLAEAIDWTRSLSSLSMMAGGVDEKGAVIRAFNYGRADTGKVTFDLCGVCGLRMGTDRKHRKCDICEQRIIDHHKRHRQAAVRETNDIDQLAQYSADHRMVLLTVSFNLAQWLAEPDNSGIFCHDAGRNKVKKKNQDAELQKIADEKIKKYQRFNSFGRFRRIWRSTEIFLEELQEQVQKLCSGSGTAHDPSLMRTILLAPQDLQIILPAARARQALDAVYDKFHKEFGRVSDRMPFHVSLCIFPFRVPIYLVLEAARRLRQSCLNKELKETKLSVYDEILLRTDTRTNGHGRERSFTYPLPMIWTQKHQPPNMLKGYDQFHANIQVQQQKEEGKASWEWQFVGNIGQGRKDWTGETARMTDNRLAIVEISSGFSLDELARPSEKLEPSRCHDIPLGYWPCLKELLRLESGLSETQQRRLRSVLALREKLWQESDLPGATPEERQDFLRESICLLWQDPSCFGPAGWKKLVKNKQNLLLEESCLNGAGFLASVVKEHLHNNDDKEQDRG